MHVILLPGKGHDRHNHPESDEILYILAGEGDQMVDDGEPQRVRPGDTVFIPKGAFHSTINTGYEPMVILAIYAPAGAEEVLKTLPDYEEVAPARRPRSASLITSQVRREHTRRTSGDGDRRSYAEPAEVVDHARRAGGDRDGGSPTPSARTYDAADEGAPASPPPIATCNGASPIRRSRRCLGHGRARQDRRTSDRARRPTRRAADAPAELPRRCSETPAATTPRSRRPASRRPRPRRRA